MKIQYMSDLHLEFSDNSRWMKHNELPVTGDVLVLAGDFLFLYQSHLLLTEHSHSHPYLYIEYHNIRHIFQHMKIHQHHADFALGNHVVLLYLHKSIFHPTIICRVFQSLTSYLAFSIEFVLSYKENILYT